MADEPETTADAPATPAKKPARAARPARAHKEVASADLSTDKRVRRVLGWFNKPPAMIQRMTEEEKEAFAAIATPEGEESDPVETLTERFQSLWAEFWKARRPEDPAAPREPEALSADPTPE